jgi:hypothetical protein
MNAASASPAPSLETATLTVSAWPECGEATIYQDLPDIAADPARSLKRKNARRAALVEALGEDGLAVHMAERSERESVRRTRTRLRRWCTKQRVDRLLTLTFRDDCLPDLDGGWALIDQFRRDWHAAGFPPLAIVPEWGTKSGRFHFHGAFRGFLDIAAVQRLWAHGFVHISHHPLGSRKGESARARERRLANYISAYVAKGDSAQSAGAPEGTAVGGPAPCSVGKNRKRYSVPVGTHPRRTVVKCADMLSAWREAERLCSGGRRMVMIWASDQSPDWLGPEMVMLQDP